MSNIKAIKNSFRDKLVPASFRNIVFHVETGQVSSGRRTVLHEYPKRNKPYAEDMGKSARRFHLTGYLLLGDRGIKKQLMDQRDELFTKLQEDDAGTLVHPTLGSMLVMCERFSYSESRTRGGYLEFDMTFVEAGSPALGGSVDAKGALGDQVNKVEGDGSKNLDGATKDMVPTLPPAPRPTIAVDK